VVVVVFVVVGLAVLGAIWWFQYHARQQRIAALHAVAGQLGFEFSIDDVHGTLGYPFLLFRRGDGRGVEHIMWGTYGELPMRLFDYWYYEETRDSRGNRSRRYRRYTCAQIAIAADCPPLRVGREGMFSRLGKALGFTDVELEYEDFNREFRVKCDDQRFAFSLLDGRMMEWLLADAGVESLEVVGPWVLFVTPRLEPAQWPALAGVAQQFHERVPRVVWSTWPRGAS
jgi:hypothetical protein